MLFKNGKQGCQTRSGWKAIRGKGLVKRVRYFQTKPQAQRFADNPATVTWGAVPVLNRYGVMGTGAAKPGIVTRGK